MRVDERLEARDDVVAVAADQCVDTRELTGTRLPWDVAGELERGRGGAGRMNPYPAGSAGDGRRTL